MAAPIGLVGGGGSKGGVPPAPPTMYGRSNTSLPTAPGDRGPGMPAVKRICAAPKKEGGPLLDSALVRGPDGLQGLTCAAAYVTSLVALGKAAIGGGHFSACPCACPRPPRCAPLCLVTNTDRSAMDGSRRVTPIRVFWTAVWKVGRSRSTQRSRWPGRCLGGTKHKTTSGPSSSPLTIWGHSGRALASQPKSGWRGADGS